MKRMHQGGRAGVNEEKVDADNFCHMSNRKKRTAAPQEHRGATRDIPQLVRGAPRRDEVENVGGPYRQVQMPPLAR